MPAVREPLRWKLAALRPGSVREVTRGILEARLGPTAPDWTPPGWLLPHQVAAARRVAGILQNFGTALLADAVGLGKTYTALAVATRYPRTTAVVPACIVPQWERTAQQLGITAVVRSHEVLSRGGTVPQSDLVIVDEAHRFRNDATKRYDALARGVGGADLLLVSATPVVNHPRDLVRLLRLGLTDAALGAFGLPSLELGAEASNLSILAHAADRLTTARTADVVRQEGRLLPVVQEGALARAPSVDPESLALLVGAARALRFPGTTPATGHLLRLHLLHRLASSTAAFRGTVTRHLAYTDRALATIGDRVPSRRNLREVLGPGDDLQFELWASAGPNDATVPCSSSELVDERHRLLHLLTLLHTDRPSPKAVRLAETCKMARKTIVFTTSAETAFELASRLSWNGVGVVAAGRGRIATGSASVQRVLDLFAPLARGASSAVHRRLALDVLIATDVASEGLNLQDADAVVHYDLPWTPVRLAQRIGRTVRLGSTLPHVRVSWFAPPLILERHLHLESRLARKAGLQTALSVPATATVGRSQLFNRAVAAKEWLRHDLPHGEPRGPGRPSYVVVRGPLALIAAVRWDMRGGVVDDVIALEGAPPRLVTDLWRLSQLFAQLRTAVALEGAIEPSLRSAFVHVLRRRLRSASTCDGSRTAAAQRRRVLATGVEAAKARDAARVALLDRVLSRLQHGTRVGAGRRLGTLLDDGMPYAAVAEWLRSTPATYSDQPGVEVLAVLAGDGSVGR